MQLLHGSMEEGRQTFLRVHNGADMVVKLGPVFSMMIGDGNVRLVTIKIITILIFAVLQLTVLSLISYQKTKVLVTLDGHSVTSNI